MLTRKGITQIFKNLANSVFGIVSELTATCLIILIGLVLSVIWWSVFR